MKIITIAQEMETGTIICVACNQNDQVIGRKHYSAECDRLWCSDELAKLVVLLPCCQGCSGSHLVAPIAADLCTMA